MQIFFFRPIQNSGYLVIGYYLHHRDDVHAYMNARQQHAAQVQRENEARFDPTGVRERLLARRRKQD